MEKEEELQPLKPTIIEKFKTKSTKDKIGLMALMWVVIAIIVLSLIDLIIDPDVFTDPMKRQAWLTRTMINTAIIVYGIIYGEQTGISDLKRKPNGIFQKALQAYHEQHNRILNELEKFSDWFVWFTAREYEYKQINYLVSKGINDAKLVFRYIDYIDLEEIQQHPIEITNKFTNKKVGILKKTAEQVEAIKFVKNGGVLFETMRASYYLSANKSSVGTTIAEEGLSLERKEQREIHISRAIKLGASLGISIVMALITFNDLSKASDLRTWANLIVRLVCLFGAMYSGLITAHNVIQIECAKLQNKEKVLLIFENDITKQERYKVLSYEEKVEEEVKE